MCGIAGYIGPHSRDEGKALLASMAAELRHRGPDGDGEFQADGVGLAHRRLAIIDLSPGGAQPMVVGDLALTYNGEIYNFRELRVELESLGHNFLTESDSEVLVHAYREWGVDCVFRFRGMWAFALWDGARKALFCSRDPFGIKPFYFATRGSAFVFASEPKALLAGGIAARADLGAVGCYLALGLSDHSDASFFSGITSLAAGARMVVSLDGRMTRLSRFDPFERQGERTTVEDFERVLRESIGFHLRSDVPVGTCLSGGLDSSVVAALAGQQHGRSDRRPFIAITAGAADASIDERPFAAPVAEQCGLEWHTTTPSADDFERELDDCLRAQGEPVLSPSTYMQYAVMRTAREVGLKVLLDGQGADELLCGYERYIGPLFTSLRRTEGLGRAASECLRYASATRRGTMTALSTAAYFASPRLRRETVRRRTRGLDPALASVVLDVVAEISASFLDLRTARLEELRRFSLPALLRFEDRSSMRFSVEARVPFVDVAVARCAMALPPTALVRDGYSKYALRTVAAKVLPPAVAWRKFKIGFESPLGSWMAHVGTALEPILRGSAVLAAASGPRKQPAIGDRGLQWRMFCVARWEQLFRVTV